MDYLAFQWQWSEVYSADDVLIKWDPLVHYNLKSSELGFKNLRHRKKQHFYWRQVEVCCFFSAAPTIIWISLTPSNTLCCSFSLKQLFQSPSTSPSPPLSPSFPVQQTEGGCWQTLPLSTKFLPVSGNPFPVQRYYNSTKSIPQEFLFHMHAHTHTQHEYMHLMAVPLTYRSHCVCVISFLLNQAPIIRSRLL